MEDSTPQEDTKPQRRFRAKLVQHEWVTAEHFDYDDVANAKEAKQKLQNFIDDEKDMGDTEYKIVVEDITPKETESPIGQPE